MFSICDIKTNIMAAESWHGLGGKSLSWNGPSR